MGPTLATLQHVDYVIALNYEVDLHLIIELIIDALHYVPYMYTLITIMVHCIPRLTIIGDEMFHRIY